MAKEKILTGNELRAARKKLGLNQKELAEKLNVSNDTICNQEKRGDEPLSKKHYSDAMIELLSTNEEAVKSTQISNQEYYNIPEVPDTNFDDDDDDAIKVAYEDTYLASLADKFDEDIFADMMPQTMTNQNNGENVMPIAPKSNSFERSFLMEEIKSKNTRIFNLEQQYNQLLSKNSIELNDKNNKISELNIKLGQLQNQINFLNEKVERKESVVLKLQNKIDQLEPEVNKGLSDKAAQDFAVQVMNNPLVTNIGDALLKKLMNTPQNQQVQYSNNQLTPQEIEMILRARHQQANQYNPATDPSNITANDIDLDMSPDEMTEDIQNEIRWNYGL